MEKPVETESMAPSESKQKQKQKRKTVNAVFVVGFLLFFTAVFVGLAVSFNTRLSALESYVPCPVCPVCPAVGTIAVPGPRVTMK